MSRHAKDWGGVGCGSLATCDVLGAACLWIWPSIAVVAAVVVEVGVAVVFAATSLWGSRLHHLPPLPD